MIFKVTNFDAFYDEKSSRLCINSAYFQFVRNFPYIEKLALALSPIVGCPVPPSLDWRQGMIHYSFRYFLLCRMFSMRKLFLDKYDNLAKFKFNT